MNGWGQDARGLWFLIKALASLLIVGQGKDEGGGEWKGSCLCFGQPSGARRQAVRARGNERFRIVVEAPLAHESAHRDVLGYHPYWVVC